MADVENSALDESQMNFNSIDHIFHEKQEGSLCAQHCLNALLQGEYFTAVDLADIAKEMDEAERLRMAESGVDSREYIQFMQEPSGNMDDSGFFSIQVISRAVASMSLELMPLTSRDNRAVRASSNPTEESAYVCNFREHWFTIRKLGFQWFNLNSLLSGPELISNTHLSLFLEQLRQEGYSIFIVTGDLPYCEANELLKINPAQQSQQPKLLSDTTKKEGEVDKDLEKALKMSKNEHDMEDESLKRAIQRSINDMDDEQKLMHALSMSLEGMEDSLPGPSTAKKDAESGKGEKLVRDTSPAKEESPSAEEVRRKRERFLERLDKEAGT